MPKKVYLDDQGHPITGTGQYLDDQGNVITGTGQYLDDQGNPLASAGPRPAPSPRSAPTPPPEAPGLAAQAFSTAKDVGVGALKGVGNTVFGMGKLVRDYTPVGRLSDAILPGAFDQRPPELIPSNTAQQVGYSAEQLGEFFLPAGAAGKVGKAADVAKSGLLTRAQGGSATDVGLSAGLTAVLPGGGVAKQASRTLQASAEKRTAQALGATKEWAKAESKKIAPEMIQRGVRGSRGAMLEQATAAVNRIGPQIGQEIKAAAARGEAVSGDIVRGQIQLARDALMTKTAEGVRTAVPGTERVIKRLDRIDRWLDTLGPDIPVDKAAAIKRTWDHLVSRAGLYGQKAGANATDSAEAWATREAASAFRQLLNTNPTLETLNKEFSFWKGLQKVLTETEKRTQAQGGGLSAAIGGSVGAAAGLASGEDWTSSIGMAAIGGAGFRKVTQLMQSPWFRTSVSSRLKASLAEALASGKADQIERIAERILVAAPAQVP